MTLGLTGATGRLGGQVTRLLADLDPVLLVRDPSRAPTGHPVRHCSYDDPGSLEGIRTLLMVSAAEHPDRVGQHRSLIDAAARDGVEHVVYTSFFGAGPEATFTLARDHWATEEHLRASGMRWTFLRDQMYADFFPYLAGEDGVIRGPAGQGLVAAVAISDVAEVAAVVLRDPLAHQGKTYDLTGPEALSLEQVAAVLTERGTPTRYHDETVAEAYASRAVFGEPDWQVEAWVSTYLAIADGSMSRVSGDVESLLGRPATSLVQLLG